MGLFDSLGAIVEAPLRIIDTTIAKPIATVAQDIADDIDDTLGGGC